MASIHRNIIHRKDIRLDIFPKLHKDESKQLNIHIVNLQKDYNTKYGSDCFFWKLNDSEDAIIINDSCYMVDNDMVNQLTLIVYWLYDRNYFVEGSFCYRIGDYTESINMIRTEKIIYHCIMKNEYRKCCFSSLRDSFLMGISQKDQNHSNFTYKEDTMFYQSEITYPKLIKKINKIEFNQKLQSKMNHFFLKMGLLFGIITIGIGSLLYATNKK